MSESANKMRSAMAEGMKGKTHSVPMASKIIGKVRIQKAAGIQEIPRPTHKNHAIYIKKKKKEEERLTACQREREREGGRCVPLTWR
jgi:hypothetical protein